MTFVHKLDSSGIALIVPFVYHLCHSPLHRRARRARWPPPPVTGWPIWRASSTLAVRKLLSRWCARKLSPPTVSGGVPFRDTNVLKQKPTSIANLTFPPFLPNTMGRKWRYDDVPGLPAGRWQNRPMPDCVRQGEAAAGRQDWILLDLQGRRVQRCNPAGDGSHGLAAHRGQQPTRADWIHLPPAVPVKPAHPHHLLECVLLPSFTALFLLELECTQPTLH